MHRIAAVEDEVARLQWARQHVSVPEVLAFGRNDAGQWLLTAALPGENAIVDRWKATPEPAVRAIGAGLRHLHDRLPVGSCPFTWSIDDRVAYAEEPDVAEALRDAAPPIDRLVVCHGDSCSPNTIVDEDGAFVGHVDLGDLGVADRWADIAVATMALEWNFGAGWEPAFYDAYGVEPDDVYVDYYQRLWNAC